MSAREGGGRAILLEPRAMLTEPDAMPTEAMAAMAKLKAKGMTSAAVEAGGDEGEADAVHDNGGEATQVMLA